MRVLGIFNQMNLVLRQEQEFLTTFLPIKYKRKQHLQKKYHLSTHAHHLESELYVVEMIKYFCKSVKPEIDFISTSIIGDATSSSSRCVSSS